MQIIPVIDLLGGQVVRGIGGRRSEYRPVESQLVASSDPGAIAAAFVEHFGARTCYVADLDAIERGHWQIEAWQAISRAGLQLWLDSGLDGPLRFFRTRHACESLGIVTEHVLGLESLAAGDDTLSHLVELCRGQFDHLPLIFSLDMKDGRPLAKDSRWQSLQPVEIAARILETGIERIILLDLADVGTGGGTRTLDLCRKLRRKAKHPNLELIAGGGVRNLDDLRRIADAGCTAALVASALHDGRLSRADWEAAAAF